MKRRLALCLLMALLFGNAAVAVGAPVADTVYVVQWGDTLSGIAARFGASLTALAEANHIKNFNLIFVGQTLTIPGGTSGGNGGGSPATEPGPAPASAGSPCASPYSVQAGDTLGLIANRCGTTVSVLLAANTIRNINLIFVGQSLTIPGSVAAGSTATPPSSGGPAPSGPVTIANPSFEDGWTTDGRGNQTPNGWTLYAPPSGTTMPFPTKMQQGAVVAAISDGPGEYAHKLSWQLPPEEHLGQPRALILDGGTVYKAFDLYHAQALQLGQTLSGPAGHSVRVTVYILGETHDTPSRPTGKLEDDHFVAAVRLGGVEDRRIYANMKNRVDIAGNQRAWNLFSVTAQFPASGQLPLLITVQQNWAGKTDFFIDDIHADPVD